MKKLCFIIPYFGKFNAYFPLFLKTCGWNKEFNWLILTDDRTPYDYPANVQVTYLSFEALRQKIQSKFDFPIALERPYKLCDLKPMYGYLFEEYLYGYGFWGHCDVDTLMGNLHRWLTDEMLESYDKLFQLGHMTIYRNTEEMNRLFMKPHRGHLPYRKVLQNANSCWFDEEWNNDSNINRLFGDYGKRIYKEDLSLNISFNYNHFVRGRFVGVENTPMPFGFEIETQKDALYLWEGGNLCRYYRENGALVREDFLYMHLQQRPMKMHEEVLRLPSFQIIPDEFIPYAGGMVTEETFDRIPRPCRSRLRQRLWWKRVRTFMNKKIWKR